MILQDFRNAKRIDDNIYDVEVETTEFGWIPMTIDTNNVETEFDYMVQLNQWIIDNLGLITDERPNEEAIYNNVLQQKIGENESNFSSTISVLTTAYTQNEINSWPKQETEARAYIADNNVSTPLLSQIATARGLTLTDLANRVIAKADTFAVGYGTALGDKQAVEDQIQTIVDSADDYATKINNLNNL
jgi:hypothetical protein